MSLDRASRLQVFKNNLASPDARDGELGRVRKLQHTSDCAVGRRFKQRGNRGRSVAFPAPCCLLIGPGYPGTVVVGCRQRSPFRLRSRRVVARPHRLSGARFHLGGGPTTSSARRAVPPGSLRVDRRQDGRRRSGRLPLLTELRYSYRNRDQVALFGNAHNAGRP
jgi:hypothetical protein